MEGLSPSLKLFNELMRGWNGFILTGDEAYEGSNELLRSPRLVNPKSYVNLSKTTQLRTHLIPRYQEFIIASKYPFVLTIG